MTNQIDQINETDKLESRDRAERFDLQSRTGKLNVCLFNDSFAPVIDGVANAVTNYAEVISSGLGSATVVTPAYPDAADDFEFDVVRYRSTGLTKKLCGYRAGYPFSSSALDELAAEDFDILHTHCPFASAMMARVLREKTNVPLVMTYHTKFDEDIAHAFPSSPHIAELVTKFVIKNISACDEVWTVSHGAGENLRSLGYEGKFIVMENGVDFPQGRADEAAARELREKYGIPGDKIMFLFVGRMMWYKGFRLILDSLKLLRERDVDFRMMFVGDGMDRSEIEKYAEELGLSDKCVFTGAINDRELLRVFYTAGDLFVFPSTYDTNGIVVREAAACGVASLLIEGSCAAEGITDGRTGILAAADPRDIAGRLEYAASHIEQTRQMGEHAMNEVYISWETSVKRAYDRYFTVIEKCMSGNSDRCRTQPFQDDFFKYVDSVTDSIQKMRELPVDLQKRAMRRREKMKKAFEAFKEILK